MFGETIPEENISHFPFFFLYKSQKVFFKTSLHLHLWDLKQEIETTTKKGVQRKENKQKNKIKSVHIHLA